MNIPDEDVAQLEIVDFEKLQASDAMELAKTLRACETRGFFILQLQNEQTQLWKKAELTFEVAEKVFQVSDKDQESFHMALSGVSELSGYKPLGYYSGIVEGRRDGFQQFRIPRIGLLQLDPEFSYDCPDIVEENRNLLQNFVESLQSVGDIILSSLSTALGLRDEERYERLHGSHSLTNSMLAFNKHPEHKSTDVDIGHSAHTDVGSIAILFATQWGLQAMEPTSQRWEYIRPLPRHVVVNVGDALKYMSGNRLRSSLHRVVPIPGVVKQEERLSLVYFLEPDRGTTFRGLNGHEYTAEEFHDMKMASFRKSHEAMEAALQTGEAGSLGHWASATSAGPERLAAVAEGALEIVA